jgi:hypothetical protein
MANLEATVPNVDHLAPGKYKGTWTGNFVRFGKFTTLIIPKQTKGINVPVELKITEKTIEIYT